MPTSRFVGLGPQEDRRLRQIEQDPLLKPKVRLRAQVLRLSGRGGSVGRIAAYTGSSRASVCLDFDRWERHGFEGLADGTAPGNPPRITEQARTFLKESLSEERTWNATQLVEAIEERFGIGVTPQAVRQPLFTIGLRWKRTRYVPSRPPDPEEEQRRPAATWRSQKGGRRRRACSEIHGRERFLPVPLPPTHTWTPVGCKHQHRVPTRWGKQGRVNLMGTLRFEGEDERLEYRLLKGSCRSGEVVGYLDLLAEEVAREDKAVVVVLDNDPFHTAGVVRDRRAGWEARGLKLYYLPAYRPHLNPIEGVWRRLKGFLMPRRFYDSLAELKQAVVSALSLLGAAELQH